MLNGSREVVRAFANHVRAFLVRGAYVGWSRSNTIARIAESAVSGENYVYIFRTPIRGNMFW